MSSVPPSDDPPRPPAPCNGCGQPRESESVTTFLVSNVAKLEENRDSGCETCPLILQGIKKCFGDATAVEGERLRLVCNGTGIPGLDVTIGYGHGRTVSFFVSPGVGPFFRVIYHSWILFCTYRYLGTQETHYTPMSWPLGYEVPEATSSPESLEWAKAKLDECITSHSCTQRSVSILPDRVLDVGGLSDDWVRLLEPDCEPGRYACLSHCWGTHAFLCTLKSNIAAHRDGILLGKLPLTFRDTIHFTRLLGLRYLWVDSLCIIQDDVDDWRAQAAKMADIYANAHLTIAAAHAEGPRAGLYSSLKPEDYAHRLCVSPTSAGDRPGPGVYARRAIAHVDNRYVGSLAASSPSNDELPLLQRAWFFQERFLSKRVLYFTSAEMAWQCPARASCQCRGDQDDVLPDHLPVKIANPRKYYHSSALAVDMDSKGMEEVARRWLDLVSDYSMLEMTFDGDVFPALSGLATVFGALMRAEYKAGLWDGSVLPGLLWYPSGSGRKPWGDRPRVWRAPSWSWASVSAGVSFPAVKGLLHPCEVGSVECQLRGPHTTGEVASGQLVLRGLVSTARVKYARASGELRPWNVYVLDFMQAGGILGNTYADYDFTAEGAGEVEDGGIVCCFLVGVHAQLGTPYLLILKEAESVPGVACGRSFSRIGFIEVFGQRVRRLSPDGTVRMVPPYQVIQDRSVVETLLVV